MRTIEQTRDFFFGTHKGHTLELVRDHAGTMKGRWYIRVFNDHGHAYNGWAPSDVRSKADAKREARKGACLDQ